MMKITQTYFDHLEKSPIGRIKLKLFKEITKKEKEVPTKKEGIKYITAIAKEYFPIAEMLTYILTNGEHRVLNDEDLSSPSNLNSLFIDLDSNPLSSPRLYFVPNVWETEDICIWVKCDKLADGSGHFYTIILFDESSSPNSIIGFIEIRVSQLNPEPAIVVMQAGKPIVISNDSIGQEKDPRIILCLKILKYISEIDFDNLIPIAKALDIENKRKINFNNIPKDKHLTKLLKQLMKRKIMCALVELKLQNIIPFSFDYCFSVSVFNIKQADRMLEKIAEIPLLVYWDGEHFIMSDDYVSYLALRKADYDMVKAVLIGRRPEGLSLIKEGGVELLPPILSMNAENLDSLPLEMKDADLQKYLNQLNAIERIRNISEAKCVIFSEDSDNSMLEVILISCGFDIDETLTYSYKSSTKLDSVEFNIRSITAINPNLKIIIHRDRDYLLDKEVQEIREKIEKLGATLFVTKGTDIESYFINLKHIHSLYPQISLDKLKEIITQTFILSQDISIQNIKKHEHGEKYKSKATYLDNFVTIFYEKEKERFVHGKTALGFLLALLQKELKLNPDLIRPSEYLIDNTLQNEARLIWPLN